MICCKCGRTIDRTYGRITDLGNYCKACAYQNEEEANQIVQSAIEKVKAQAVKEFAEKLKEKIKSLKVAEDEDYIFKCGFDVLQENLPEIIDEILKEYEK